MYAVKFEVLCHIAGSVHSRYRAIAFDGNHFYLTLPQNQEIHVFDCCGQRVGCVKTCRRYDYLCFDPCRREFWAITEGGRQVFRLNCALEEFDCISVSCQEYPLRLTGVSCGEHPDTLFVASPQWIAQIRARDQAVPSIIREFPNAMHASVAYTAGFLYQLASTLQGDTLYVETEDCEETYALPGEYRAEGIAAGECGSLYILVRGRYGHQCILKCTFGAQRGRDLHYQKCYTCKPCYEPCSEPCPEPHCEPRPEPCCDPCEKPCPRPRCDDCACGAGDVIESVALMEAALSHILNAEGEKLQKVLATSDDMCEILEANQSVRETISSITHMEHVLYDKLHLASGLCKDRQPPPCCEPDPCCEPC